MVNLIKLFVNISTKYNFSDLLVRPAQVFCYLTSWSSKRPGIGKFEPKDIEASLCTHIVYAFATLKDHLLTEVDDDEPEKYERLIALRAKNSDLQVNLK